MKILKFLSVFAILGILFSCSVPKTPAKTYSKSLIVGKTYVGNWSGTYYAVQFIDDTGNHFKVRQNTGNDQNTAVSGLNSTQEWQGDLNSATGEIKLLKIYNEEASKLHGIRYRIQSENAVDRLKPLADADFNVSHTFEGTMHLYTTN